MATLLMTSTLLVAGGLGIYLWKSNADDEDLDENKNASENNSDEYTEYDEYNEEDEAEKPRQKKAVKTRRNKRRHTGTKRRHGY